ncbi:MAG: transglycosylase SLT domain-containing protein [Gammaproteobacteria bacterium]
MPLRRFSACGARRFGDLRRCLAAGAVFAGCVVFACTSIADAETPATLGVLKLRHHEINHPHRDVDGELSLLRGFARDRGLVLRWIDAVSPGELARRAAAGDGDVVIADLPPGAAQRLGLAPTRPLGSFEHVVWGGAGLAASDPTDLAGMRVAITLSSPMWPYLSRLENTLENLSVVVLPDDRTRAAVLEDLAAGDYDAAVLPGAPRDDLAARRSGVRRLFTLSPDNAAVWHLRRDDEALRAALNDYVERYHARVGPPRPHGDGDAHERRVLRVITRIDAHNYFLERGRPAGFEYDLVRRFARGQGLGIEVLVAEDDAQALEWLRAGAGDLVSTRVDAGQVAQDPRLGQSRHYFHSADVIVTGADSELLTADALAGARVAAIGGSVQHRALGQLIADGVSARATVLAADTPLEDVAAALLAGRLDAAILDAHVAAALKRAFPGLAIGASLPPRYPYAWTVRTGDRQLADAVDEFLRRIYRRETYNVAVRRYHEQPRFARLAAPGSLSPYDELVQRYAERFEFDWRLIVAQMYQESKFVPDAESPAGARGLMQLLPATAREVGVDDPFDPEAGIRGGIAYLDSLRRRFDDGLAPRERTWFALAAYNIGYARVQRARRQAAELGLDPGRWFGNVETVMRRMARSGAGCRCGETVVYVRRIRSLYTTYNRFFQTFLAAADRIPRLPAG